MKSTSGSKETSPAPVTGSLAELISDAQQPSWRSAFAPSTMAKVAVLGGLLVALNWWQFPGLIEIWRDDPNWAHGFIIPLFSLYLLYNRRERLFEARRETCLWGLPILLISIAITVIGFYPLGVYWLCRMGMVGMLFGVVLYLAGRQAIKVAWLPIVYLSFAMPIPEMLYAQLALWLQNFAAKSSTMLLTLFGTRIDVSASRLTITSRSGVPQDLTVAEACSGIRSMMAYLALGVAWAYLENRPVWQRVVLVISAVPIAILTNILRVTITASMFVIDKPEWGRDFMHEFTGMLMLVPALGLFVLLGWLLKNLFVEVEEQDKDVQGARENPSERPGE